MKKNLICGLGEIGKPIYQLISKNMPTVGYDLNKKLMDEKKFIKFEKYDTDFLHICIPFNKHFIKNVISISKKFSPNVIVIHSTISPYTTNKIQKNLKIPVIYSATRGVHKRMQSDLKRYTKFFAIESNAPNKNPAIINFRKLMKKCGVKTQRLSNPITLELSKIVVDTSYYGWLINYSQISNLIAKKYKVNYDEMWSFADEIHKFLGNRPKMYPGFIGGHCVVPNLELINEDSLYQIDKINNHYARKVKNSKSIRKKYDKSKASYNI